MHEIDEDKKYLHVQVPIYGTMPLLETCEAQREHRRRLRLVMKDRNRSFRNEQRRSRQPSG